MEWILYNYLLYLVKPSHSRAEAEGMFKLVFDEVGFLFSTLALTAIYIFQKIYFPLTAV